MRKIVILFAVGAMLVGTASFATAQQCRQPPGAVNPGNQCGVRAGTNLEELIDIASAQGCKFKCEESSQCRAWTYVIAHKVCHLKGQAEPVAADNCCSTGIRFN